MEQPRAGQVWGTKAGRTVLLVSKTQMLWFDETDKEFVLSNVRDRLELHIENSADFKSFLVRAREEGVMIHHNCPMCDDKKEINCPACNPSGQKKHPTQCALCKGNQVIKCPKCNK